MDRSITAEPERKEGPSIPVPFGSQLLQHRNMPCFNRRRGAVGTSWVRNPTTGDSSGELTESLFAQETQTPVKSAKRVRPVIVPRKNDLPYCGVGSCTHKASYSDGSKVPTRCSVHRRAQHVCLFSTKAWRHYCHCGAKAIYRVEGQAPTTCYWHRMHNQTPFYEFERHSIHHKGKFVGSYTVHAETPADPAV